MTEDPKPESVDESWADDPAFEIEHDEVTRRLMEFLGGPPTPEQDKKLRRDVERLVRRDRHPELDLQYIHLKPDPITDKRFDPDEEARIASRHGVDITKDPDWLYLKDIVERGRERRDALRCGHHAPKKALRALSLNLERSKRSRQRKNRKLEKDRRVSLLSAKKRSKVSRAKAARNPDRDYDILQEIHGYLKAQLPVRLTPKRSELVHPSRKSPLLPSSTIGRSTTHDRIVWLPRWDKASLPLRAMAMGIACGNLSGFDFTLHLDDDAIEYAMGVGEMKFAQRIYRRIDDTLKTKQPKNKLPSIEIMLCIEQGIGERPHVHGIILPERPLSRGQRTKLRDALTGAGGSNWKANGHDKTQAELGSLYEPAGWIKYITKYTEITKAKLGDNTFASSWEITRLGKAWYEGARKNRLLLLPGKATAITPP